MTHRPPEDTPPTGRLVAAWRRTRAARPPSEETGQAALTRWSWSISALNGLVGLAITTLPPGTSPAFAVLAMLAPLPVWGGLLIASAALRVLRLFVACHLAALPTWLMICFGAGVGLFTRATPSPLGSVCFCVLAGFLGFQHVIGLRYRRGPR